MKDNTVFILLAKFLGFHSSNNKTFAILQNFRPPPPLALLNSYSGGTMSSLPIIHWQERVREHFHLVPKVWIYEALPTRTLIRTRYLSTGLNTWTFLDSHNSFNNPNTSYLSNTLVSLNFNFVLQIILSLQKRCKKSRGNSDIFEPRVSGLTCQVCMYIKTVDILDFMLGKIR